MPRYFFDVHDDGDAQWDDVGRDCEGRESIKSHVRTLLTLAAARQRARSVIVPTTTVIVHRETGGIALTAISKLGREIQFIWSPD